MARISFALLASLFSLSLMLSPHLAHAGLFLDAYIGGAYTRDGNIHATIADTMTNATINTDNSRILGGRIGYWIDPIPWIGLALDVSYFKTEGEAPEMIGEIDQTNFDNLAKADFKMLPISALLMLRLPSLLNPMALVTGLNPYFGVGPTLLVTQVDFEEFSGSGAALGFDVRAGLRWEFFPIIGLFAEYRYTRVEDTFKDTLRGVSTALDVNLSTHYILGGISLRF